jgi:glutamate-1-semialdehyde 2,1-aminomutase
MSLNTGDPRFKRSAELFVRAAQVIPWGIYGHASPVASLPGAFPYYAERAKGCQYWDVDGNEYIDYLCGYGPMILGHQHPEVEEAAARQQRDALCLNHPGPVMVELAEKLVSLVEFSAWAVFGKNGSDMTAWAMQVAREHTKRRKILKVSESYHGIAPAWTPGHGGLIEEDRVHIHDFDWNDLESFETCLKQHRGDVAAVIMTPFHHPAFKASQMPAPGFWQHIEAACRKEGIVLILDDIRAGFRLNLHGSHKVFGFEPDLICFCKALANGHALSATLGRKELRVAASKVFLTGSFWNSAPAMAASMACLNIMEREDVVTVLRHRGDALMNGLIALGQKHGYEMVATGPPALPFPVFVQDPDLRRQQRFCGEVTRRGALFHPHHNWFLSMAHQPAHIEATLGMADEAMTVMRSEGA